MHIPDDQHQKRTPRAASTSPGRTGKSAADASTRTASIGSSRQGTDLGQLQRKIGNRAVGRLVAELTPIQRFRDVSTLYRFGWKYSGGNMATHSGLDALWHATVFRVDKSGKSAADGLFFNGFHLTMQYGPAASRIDPHVFFDASGAYDEAATLGHPQTKTYMKEVSGAQWEFDLKTAKDLSKSVLGTIGEVLSLEDREKLEEAQKAKQELAKDKSEQEAAEALKKKHEDELSAAAAKDESTSVDVLLKDVVFPGPSYRSQFDKYLAGDKEAIKDTKLKLVAEWYVKMRDEKKWIVTEDPKAAYEGWSKTPAKVTWPAYQNCLTRTWRAKSETGLMSEFRMLKFNGYASYKLHPKAIKPPKV